MIRCRSKGFNDAGVFLDQLRTSFGFEASLLTVSKSAEKTARTTGPKLWIVLARAYGAVADYVEGRIAAEGLCLSDFMLLEVLLHKGPMTISGIGEKVLLANPSMTAAVDRLEERGFVVRQSAENDRRSKMVALTARGSAFISELYARHATDIETVTSVLSRKEQETLRAGLKKLGLAAREAVEGRAPARAGAQQSKQDTLASPGQRTGTRKPARA